jgi:hypothetical protein
LSITESPAWRFESSPDSKDADATNTHGKDSQPLQDALNKLSGMNSKAEAIEWAKTLPDAVKTHESFRQAFSKKF